VSAAADARVPTLESARLVLTPLRPADAERGFASFADPAIYRYMVGVPPADVDALREEFARLAKGCPRPDEIWANWLAWRRDDRALVGWHQATVTPPTASIAWVTFPAHRRAGYAREGAAAMIAWLATRGVTDVTAQSDERNVASWSTAASLGFAADAGTIAEELRGEATVDRIWRLRLPGPPG
jgi:RimJ/RimL family protein N-acetyltransferase